MVEFLIRRRRLLAAFVALGAITPGAFAKEKGPCFLEAQPTDSPVIAVKGGAFKGNRRQSWIDEVQVVYVKPFHQKAAPGLEDLEIEAAISLYQEDSRTLHQSFLGFQAKQAQRDYDKLPAVRHRFLFQYTTDGGPETIEFDGWLGKATHWLERDSELFGKFTGVARMFVFLENSATPETPDFVFSFLASDLNYGHAYATEARRRGIALHEKKDCKPVPYVDPMDKCFLTTATVQTIGLPDNCWELEALRRFRDGWLADQASGNEDIAQYYDRAPAIAERLRADPRRLTRMYFTGILPSAIAARMGLNRLARSIYSHHMRRLAPLAA